jgi:hypothetical protein
MQFGLTAVSSPSGAFLSGLSRSPDAMRYRPRMLRVVSYTIYHSPNAYLGTVLATRALAELPVEVVRRPMV